MPNALRRYFKKVNLQILVGVALVIVSVLSVVFVVFANTKTVRVYTATKTISVGEKVEADTLKEIEIPEGAFSKLYFSAHNIPKGNDVSTDANSARKYIARYPIFEGEPILLSALANADTTKTSIVIPIKSKLPDSLEAGSRIAIWVGKKSIAATEDEDTRVKKVIPDAQIVRIAKDEVLGSSSATSVEVRVMVEEVPVLLNAIVHDDFVGIVPQIKEKAQ